MSIRADVVVVTRDTRTAVLRCIQSLEAESSVERRIVVDNGSTDGTATALAERFSAVEVLRNERNEGYARACNRGAAAGTAPLVLFLNSDIVAQTGAADRLVAFLAGSPGHVAVAGRLVGTADGRPQAGFAIRGYPTLIGQAAQLAGLERLWPANPLSRRQLQLDFDFERTQDLNAQPAGACLLVRRETFERVGGFDDGFDFWFEDVDLLARMRRLGRIAYVHDAVFEHVGALSANARPRADLVGPRYAGLLRYFEKHRPAREAAALRAVVAVTAVARAAAAIRRDRAAAAAYAAAARAALARGQRAE